MARAVRSGDIGPGELVDAHIKRMGLDGAVNAVVVRRFG
jgi:hypothetical protein